MGNMGQRVWYYLFVLIGWAQDELPKDVGWNMGSYVNRVEMALIYYITLSQIDTILVHEVCLLFGAIG